MSRSLLSVDDLGAAGIQSIMRLSDSFAEVSSRSIPRVPALRGKTIAALFYEDSTRTRLSFEAAAKRLSADVMSFAVKSSSMSKGESLRDTVQTLGAMGADAFVVRHASAGAARLVSRWTDAAVVNAGDGWHEHPTQALADCYTLHRRFGGAAFTMAGLHAVIVGDVKHSRVARSNVKAFTALGARVTLVGPATLMPPCLDGWPVSVEVDLDRVLPDADIVYLLRLQSERTDESLLPSQREYTARWGLTRRRAALLPGRATVMHPGPMNRGVEIDPEVADREFCVVGDQVRNGVPVRMAVLFWLLGSGLPTGESSGQVLAVDGGDAHQPDSIGASDEEVR